MQRGFSTIEIILALTILSTALAAIVIVELGTPSSLANGSLELKAYAASSLLLDTSFRYGLSDFAAVNSVASTTSLGITTSLQVKSLPDGITKSLTSNASWIDIEGGRHFISLYALITDFSQALPNPCSSTLSGNWTQLQSHTFSLTPGNLLPMGFSPLHPIATLTVSGSTLVGGVATTTTKSDPSLFIFDISSTTEPKYLGSVDNATSTIRGVNGIAAYGNYLYVANASQPNFGTCTSGPSCSQLQLFDDTNPALPVNISNVELATTSLPFATGSGGQSIGKSIAYGNGLVYLGLTKTANPLGEEFNVIDVHNPHSPVWLGGFSIGRSINRIRISGSYAYLATDDPTREFIILDIHDPTHITVVGSYDAPGASTFGYGNDVTAENTTAFLGRTYSPNGPGLSILSIASSAPQLLSSEQIASPSSPLDVEAILVRDFMLFVLTNSALELFDVHDPTQPVPYGNSFSLPDGSSGSSLSCRGNTLYVGSVAPNQTGFITTLTGS